MTVSGSDQRDQRTAGEAACGGGKCRFDGPMGAREVVDGWLHSPGHRRNIEGDFRLTGIGLATAEWDDLFHPDICAIGPLCRAKSGCALNVHICARGKRAFFVILGHDR
jgi:hypothetical protein